MKPVFALLRREGIHCFNYIDDCFVIADTKEKCRDSVNRLENLLRKLGFTGADPGFLKGGVQIRSTSKKGGARRGSNFGPNVKKPTSWHKRVGGPDPLAKHGTAS